ncbi:hypothetical protein K439DRAFT_1414340 [Ramaria rubella]|nr:hypothetical protein K439DRAFT_1414340 [Ramaria rubella]
MTTLGLPYFFQDSTGLILGPADFLDIYDRPPFLHIDSTPTRYPNQPHSTTLAIYERGTPSYRTTRRRRDDKSPPSAVLVFNPGLTGTVKFRSQMAVPMDGWLKKSNTFGSTLMRQFDGSDGMHYQWSHRSLDGHEWTCIQLPSNYLVAHYDIPSPEETPCLSSGNMLTIDESWIHLAIELFASFSIMRHIHATGGGISP